MMVIWQSEIDPYGSRVLAKHWPHVPNLGDVTKIDWSSVERPDLVCGGYPCQPFSVAGSRRGTDDARHLWPHFADALRVLRPEWALLENVPGHLSLGFGDVLGDLADLGYDTEWECIPAAAVGAPHLRWRLFVVAHANRSRCDGNNRYPSSGRSRLRDDARGDARPEGPGPGGPVANADSRRWEEPQDIPAGEGFVFLGTDAGRCGHDVPVSDCFGRPGIQRPEESGMDAAWEVEPGVGRVADGVPSRVDRLRCLGNAVVPQVAEWIGSRLLEHIGASA